MMLLKKARGINNEDFGEIQDIQGQYVLVQKGILNKERFYIPKDLAESYDGYVLRFRFSEQELNQYYEDPLSIRDSHSLQETAPLVILTEERLDISKKSQENQATITKKSVTETKTEQVQLMHEDISIERRPPSGQIEAQPPMQSYEDIKIPLKREEVRVTKKPYVKEEVMLKKKAFTDNKEITEDTTS
jgi:uncharacterized protein (TIGR02271 family)